MARGGHRHDGDVVSAARAKERVAAADIELVVRECIRDPESIRHSIRNSEISSRLGAFCFTGNIELIEIDLIV